MCVCVWVCMCVCVCVCVCALLFFLIDLFCRYTFEVKKKNSHLFHSILFSDLQ